MKIYLLCILVGTAAAFSSGFLVNINKHRVQKLQRQNARNRKMAIKFTRLTKQYSTKTVYNHQFALKFLEALAKQLDSRRH